MIRRIFWLSSINSESHDISFHFKSIFEDSRSFVISYSPCPYSSMVTPCAMFHPLILKYSPKFDWWLCWKVIISHKLSYSSFCVKQFHHVKICTRVYDVLYTESFSCFSLFPTCDDEKSARDINTRDMDTRDILRQRSVVVKLTKFITRRLLVWFPEARTRKSDFSWILS